MFVTELKPKGTIYKVKFSTYGNLIRNMIDHPDYKKVFRRKPKREKITIPVNDGACSERLNISESYNLIWYDMERGVADIGYLRGNTFWVLKRENLIGKFETVEDNLGFRFSTKYDAKIDSIEKT